MKILTYSDLHLEHGAPWIPPGEDAGDVLVLAGDIVNLTECEDLYQICEAWRKPIVYVLGNHEFYTGLPMVYEADTVADYLKEHYPHVHLLRDEAVVIDGVQFFGGTMWTDFNDANPNAMWTAQNGMSDFRLIHAADGSVLRPQDTVGMHREFVEKLRAWFDTPLDGPRVVVTHHAPCMNPNTQYRNSPLQAAFNSLDMVAVMEEYVPDLWCYGHTHENDNRRFVHTQVISNQRGYPRPDGSNECRDFDEQGCPVEI